MCGVQGLEVYSTVLWHMKKEVEVSYLAQEAIAQDRRSPHAWAIMGNCFSLQKVYLPFTVCTERHACCLVQKACPPLFLPMSTSPALFVHIDSSGSYFNRDVSPTTPCTVTPIMLVFQEGPFQLRVLSVTGINAVSKQC